MNFKEKQTLVNLAKRMDALEGRAERQDDFTLTLADIMVTLFGRKRQKTAEEEVKVIELQAHITRKRKDAEASQ